MYICIEGLQPPYSSPFFTEINLKSLNMNALKIDRTKLITQAAYAKKTGLSAARINQKVKAGELKSITIEGATLIYLG